MCYLYWDIEGAIPPSASWDAGDKEVAVFPIYPPAASNKKLGQEYF